MAEVWKREMRRLEGCGSGGSTGGEVWRDWLDDVGGGK